jgi:hypothetical protein
MEIRLAGFTLTDDEWQHLPAELRADMLPLDGGEEEELFEDDADVVW